MKDLRVSATQSCDLLWNKQSSEQMAYSELITTLSLFKKICSSLGTTWNMVLCSAPPNA